MDLKTIKANAAKGVKFSEMATPKKKGIKLPKKESKAKTIMELQLKVFCDIHKMVLQKEYLFHDKRKWRFDFAIAGNRKVRGSFIGIEYEGIISSKSRHTTISGYTEDMNKYNEAQKLGWIVLRYSALNAGNLINDLKCLVQ